MQYDVSTLFYFVSYKKVLNQEKEKMQKEQERQLKASFKH